MSTYDETQHPRGQAANAGQYRAKENDAPTNGLSDGRGPLLCVNDEPHAAHTQRNQFGGTDYCSGRPDLAKAAPHTFDDHHDIIDWGIRLDGNTSGLHESIAGQWQDELTKRGSIDVLGAEVQGSFQRQAATAYLQGLAVGERLAQQQARASAIRAAGALWGPSTQVPRFEELESGVSGPNAHAVEYLRGQIETIADTFGGGDDAHQGIYEAIVATIGDRK